MIYQIDQNNQKDYIDLDEKLNNSTLDLLVVEHEYGIYGGDYGAYLLDLLKNLDIPVITTLHTILKKPNHKQKLIIKALGEKSEKIITMARIWGISI
ncbi:MAG TPA: hypothetical protein VIK72_10100 [Clostridiaceae bacterium]